MNRYGLSTQVPCRAPLAALACGASARQPGMADQHGGADPGVRSGGTRCQIGRIAGRLAERAPATQFERGLARFGYMLTRITLAMSASTFTRSQVAAIFSTMIGTMVPAIEFAGLINPVAALEAAGRIIGEAYPASHMLTISRGVFAKALGVADLGGELLALLAAIPVILGLAIAALPKQER